MLNEIITGSSEETFNLGKEFSKRLEGGEIICLSGDLGSGKTTFTQGILRGFEIEGALGSPTFMLMKEYDIKDAKFNIKKVYHIDTYRIAGEDDIISLGWEELLSDKINIIIVEWPEKIKSIIPRKAIWINFKYVENDKRKINFKS